MPSSATAAGPLQADMIMVCALQIGNLKGESGGAVATQQHLQRRRKNLIKVLDNVKVPIPFSTLSAHLLLCPPPRHRLGLPHASASCQPDSLQLTATCGEALSL